MPSDQINLSAAIRVLVQVTHVRNEPEARKLLNVRTLELHEGYFSSGFRASSAPKDRQAEHYWDVLLPRLHPCSRG